MIDLEQQIRGYYEAIIDPVDVEEVTAADSASAQNEGSWWRGPLVAVAAAVVVVVAVSAAVLLVFRSETVPESDVVQPSIEASEVLIPESWDPILAETTASPAPPSATCPTFSIPEAEDVAAWPKPYASVWPQAVAFDQHAGNVIYPDYERTWAFDVCTNTWTVLHDHPERALLWLSALVYDVDSDKTVSFGVEKVAVLDADTGIWTEHAYPSRPYERDAPTRGAIYDPVSGLIVTAWDDRLLRAYDVDTNTWHEIGAIPTPSEQDSVELYGTVELLGYSPTMDRFIATIAELTAWPALPVEIPTSPTLLVDPRTGRTSVIPTRSPGYPFNRREGPFRYGALWQTADSVVVDRQGFPLCEFNAETLTWDACHTVPDETTAVDPDAGVSSQPAPFDVDTIVEDTINNRLLFIAFRDYHAPQIWAHDQDTNQWTRIPFAIGN